METIKNKVKIIQEFKDFAIKGNAIDLAVGVVIGAAFGKIVSSLVDDIINPIIGLLTGGIDFSDKAIVLKAATEAQSAVTINYGLFVTVMINFVIVAWAIFLIVKGINKLKRAEAAKEEAAPKPTPEEILLLREIRDKLSK